MPEPGYGHRSRFPTTSWTIVVKARNRHTSTSQQALNTLCSSYWHPIYAFIRRKGLDPDEAADTTQEFFARVIEKDYLVDTDPSKGKFRSFLMAAVSHFLSNRLDSERAIKRGGRQQFLSLDFTTAENICKQDLRHCMSPEDLFEYHWALTVLDRTLNRLHDYYSDRDFERLKPFLIAETERGKTAETAVEMGLSEGAFRVAVHRLRKRYREALRAEIAETVSDDTLVDGEISYLLNVVGRAGGASAAV